MLLRSLNRALDSSIDKQGLVVLEIWSDSTTPLLVVALSPGSFLSSRLRRVEFAYSQAREAFDQVGAVVVDCSEMRRTSASKLAVDVCRTPSDDFGTPRLVNVTEAVHLRFCLRNGSEETWAACSGFVICVV